MISNRPKEPTLSQDGKENSRYWYSCADVFQLLSYFRLNYLEASSDDPYESNDKGIVLLNPQVVSTLKESLKHKEIKENVTSVIFPLMDGRHWMVGRLFFLKKQKKQKKEPSSSSHVSDVSDIEFLFVDSYGPSHSNVMVERVLKEITDAFPQSYVKLLLKQLHQLAVFNGWDCGPISVQNIKDFLIRNDYSCQDIVKAEGKYYSIQYSTDQVKFAKEMREIRSVHCKCVEDFPINQNVVNTQLKGISDSVSSTANGLRTEGKMKETLSETSLAKLTDLSDEDYLTVLSLVPVFRDSLSLSGEDIDEDDLIDRALLVLRSEGSPIDKNLMPLIGDVNLSLTSLRSSLRRLAPATLTSDFTQIHSLDSFIDKSSFLVDFIEVGAQCSVISRPRKFGKTTLLTMVKAFFKRDDTKDPQDKRREIFQNLLVGNSVECMKEFGTRDVIYLDLSKTTSDTYKGFIKLFRKLMFEVMVPFKDLISNLGPLAKQCYSWLLTLKDEDLLPTCISDLCDLIGTNPLILIDEYDCHHSLVNPSAEMFKIQNFIQKFFAFSFKSNRSYWRAILTGVLPFKNYPTSSFNNAVTFTVVDRLFNDCCGFTEMEVTTLFDKLGLTDEDVRESIKQFYNGYNFGGITIYNTFSMVHLFASVECGAEWEQIENVAAEFLSPNFYPEISTSLLKLIALKRSGSQPTPTRFEESLSFGKASRPSDFLTIFTHFGYLTAVVKYSVFSQTLFEIPNAEVLALLERFVLEKSNPEGKMPRFRGNLELKFDFLKDEIVKYLVSSRKTIFSPNEDLFHLIISFVCIHFDQRYVFGTEIPSGFGYCDAMFYPSAEYNADAFILHEYKYYEMKTYEKQQVDVLQQFALYQIFIRDYLSYPFERSALFPRSRRFSKVILRGIVGFMGTGTGELGVAYEELELTRERAEKLRKFFTEGVRSIKGKTNSTELIYAMISNHPSVHIYIEEILSGKVLPSFQDEIVQCKSINKRCPVPGLQEELLSPIEPLVKKRHGESRV
jgi:hypothetical protein